MAHYLVDNGGTVDTYTDTPTGLWKYRPGQSIQLDGGNITLVNGSFIGPITPTGAINIKVTSATAFTVGNAGGVTTYFTVDTSTPAITLNANTTASVAAATNAAFKITDGTTTYYATDTRTAVSGAIAHTFSASAPTIVSASGTTYNKAVFSSYTLTLTGGVTVTALNSLQTAFASPTVTSASSTTVTNASTVRIHGPLPAGSVTFTTSAALDVPTYATNGTTAYGVLIAAPTGAAANIALQVNGNVGTTGTVNFGGAPDAAGNLKVSAAVSGNGAVGMKVSSSQTPTGNNQTIYGIQISSTSTLQTATFTGTSGQGLNISTVFNHGSGGNFGIEIGVNVSPSYDLTGSGTAIWGVYSSGITADTGSATAYHYNAGNIVGAAAATFAQINTGSVSGAGTQSGQLVLGANSSTATTNYGILVGAVSGAGTTNVGLKLGAVSGAGSNFAIQTAGGLVNLYSASAATAAGSLINALTFGTSPGVLGMYWGSGAPTIAAPKGSSYHRTDGSGTADRFYIATDSSGTWTPVVTVG